MKSEEQIRNAIKTLEGGILAVGDAGSHNSMVTTKAIHAALCWVVEYGNTFEGKFVPLVDKLLENFRNGLEEIRRNEDTRRDQGCSGHSGDDVPRWREGAS